MRKPLPDASVLKDLLHYDPETGSFTWRARRPYHFAETPARTPEWACRWWNSRFESQPAGFTDPSGYLLIRVNGVDYRAHRIAWVYVYGTDPDTIDHVNGDRADNRIENLRDVDATGNARNAKRRDDNISGTTGVGFYPKTGRWRARINRGGKTVLLGYFDTKEEAIAARKVAESEGGYAPRHGQP
jgi:hypothetical protein